MVARVSGYAPCVQRKPVEAWRRLARCCAGWHCRRVQPWGVRPRRHRLRSSRQASSPGLHRHGCEPRCTVCNNNTHGMGSVRSDTAVRMRRRISDAGIAPDSSRSRPRSRSFSSRWLSSTWNRCKQSSTAAGVTLPGAQTIPDNVSGGVTPGHLLSNTTTHLPRPFAP